MTDTGMPDTGMHDTRLSVDLQRLQGLSPTQQGSHLQAMYAFLTQKKMDQHARDFWRVRAGKQQELVRKDPLAHQYTAICQYLNWHAEDGRRLPSFEQGTAKSLQHRFVFA